MGTCGKILVKEGKNERGHWPEAGVCRCHTPAALCATSLVLSMPCATSRGTFDPVCSHPVVASICSNRITTSTVCACVVHNSIM